MEAFSKVFSVAVGGAFGAVARYLINISPLAGMFEKFPLPTFVINVSGSFLIGFLLILLTDRFEVSETFRLSVIVGFLGAFTTFSTFEMEVYGLTSEREHLTALLYLLLSVVGGFVAVVAGVRLARLF
ncbi:MAG: fluoride efflux transporter CrcB [Pyrinomonadaceae bacterium]